MANGGRTKKKNRRHNAVTIIGVLQILQVSSTIHILVHQKLVKSNMNSERRWLSDRFVGGCKTKYNTIRASNCMHQMVCIDKYTIRYIRYTNESWYAIYKCIQFDSIRSLPLLLSWSNLIWDWCRVSSQVVVTCWSKILYVLCITDDGDCVPFSRKSAFMCVCLHIFKCVCVWRTMFQIVA